MWLPPQRATSARATLICVNPHALTRDQIDTWIERRGPAREVLLAPLAPLLEQPGALPDNFELIIEPARWLLEQAGVGGLPLDHNQLLRPGYAARANWELGFDSQPFDNGRRTSLEVDVLLDALRGLGATEPIGPRETLTPPGSAYLGDPPALWQAVSASLGFGREDGCVKEERELVLGWLLQDHLAFHPLLAALSEATGGDPTDEVLPAVFGSLYTQLRAVCAFVPRSGGDSARLRLRPSGREAALEGLRAAIAATSVGITGSRRSSSAGTFTRGDARRMPECPTRVGSAVVDPPVEG
ncbi:MAG: hypothetical protein ACRDJ5_09130 [Actinomycetota bacterium]